MARVRAWLWFRLSLLVVLLHKRVCNLQSTSTSTRSLLLEPEIQKFEMWMTAPQSPQVSPAHVLEINLGYLTGSKRKPDDIEYSRPGLTISGGLTYALNSLKSANYFGSDNANPLSLSVAVKVNVYIAETYGDEEISLSQIARLWRLYNISVIIGPQESCLHEAKLASSLNIPMISYFCSDEQPSDKKQFTTFSRTRPPDAAISRAVTSLVINYGWVHSVVIIYSDSSEPSSSQRFQRVGKSLSLLLKQHGVRKVQMIGYRGPYHHGYGENPFEAIVSQTKGSTRIYIVISEYYEHLGLVLALKKQSLLQKGEYLVIGVSIDEFKEEKWNPTNYFHGLLYDESSWPSGKLAKGRVRTNSTLSSTSNTKQPAKSQSPKRVQKPGNLTPTVTVTPQDFASYLGIIASPPKDFTNFSNQVNYYMEQEPFRYPNPLAIFGKNKRIRIEAAYLYDAVVLYLQMVRDVIQEEINSATATGTEPPATARERTNGSSTRKSTRRPSPGGPTDVINIMDSLKRKIFNGLEISERLRNVSYKSATGHDSEMDENGDARGNFTLVSLKRAAGAGGATGGELGLYPVGIFLKTSASRSTSNSKPGELPAVSLSDTIDWVGGVPPVSEPKCGFYNEKCESDNNSILISAIALMGIALTSSAIYLSFRHWRLSKDMDTLMWRIDKREIQWEDGHLFPKERRSKRMVVTADPNSQSRSSICSNQSQLNNNTSVSVSNSGVGGGGKGQGLGSGLGLGICGGGGFGDASGSQASLIRFSTVYAPLVTYRERHFAAKKIDVDVFDSSMKQQLQMLREIRHENLNVFIGACHYEDGLLMISDYCSRGSIRDILDNEAIKLDDMFISSLVGDLLRGLAYLHNSTPFKFHGNLKPSNCLVDSRWVLKLTDFGFIRTASVSRNNSSKKRGSSVTVPELGEPQVFTTGSTCSLHATGTPTTKLTTTVSIHHTCKAQSAGGWIGHNHLRHSQHQHQLPITCTCPYLAPEYPILVSGQVKNAVDGFRRADIYSLGIILWELLRRDSLENYTGFKSENELRQHIIMNSSTFWSRALGSLSHKIQTGKTFATTPTTGALLCPPSPNFIRSSRQSSFYKNSRFGSSYSPISNKIPPPSNATGSKYHAHAKQQPTNMNNNICNDLTNAESGGGGIPSMNSSAALSSSSQIIETLSTCLQFDPDLRPDIKTVGNRLRPLHKGMRSNIFDIMIGLMEKYANNLEILVDERTKQLSEEKRKTESLLYELIPPAVAEELKEGHHVSAQSYECVQIFFSDIVGFTAMSAESTPLQVVEFLNDLYTCFDSVIDNFDVYKVETIGDAYMVASGLPIPKEGNLDALEMARMALQLLHAVKTFKIHHRPTEILKLRCGIHSGPVCSGVVGHKRPRYCLFGDTVNTASRMESTGAPLRIHCSQAFASLVADRFELEQRGVVDVKGKGDMMTFWLIGGKERSTTNTAKTTSTTGKSPVMTKTIAASVMVPNIMCTNTNTNSIASSPHAAHAHAPTTTPAVAVTDLQKMLEIFSLRVALRTFG